MADLVDANSVEPLIASWDHPLADPNIEDARIIHKLAPLARVPGLAGVESRYRKRFRLKSWQYMTAVTDDLFVAFVVGTAGFASNGFIYAAALPGGQVHKKMAITPLGLGTVLAPSSVAGGHRFATRGISVAIDNQREGRRFVARLAAQTDSGPLEGELVFETRAGCEDQHLSLCVPLPGGRWHYTHKYGGFDVTGQLTIAGKRIAFAPGRSFGTMDFTKMYALRHAVWRWIALCGKTRQGATIGLNLVDPTPLAPISENAAWIDGRYEPITNVRLGVEPPGEAESGWTATADSIDLTMRAVANVEQKLDLPLVRHKLRHVVGAFSGHVRTASGHVHDLDSIVGIAEDYDTWW
ncbi:MAG: DUF2804 domain-containing protein [Kofleriaceae bacterium]